MKKSLSVLLFILTANLALAQTYTTNNNGGWNIIANWQSGSVPATSGGGGTINVNHNMTVAGTYSQPNGTLNIAANKTMTVNGDFAKGVGGGGGNLVINGTLYITGNMTINAPIQINPGGQLIVDGDVTVISSNYLKVGTNVTPGSYADLIVRGSLKSQSSGDVTIEKNGRVAIFKDLVSDGGGGVVIDIKSGGQVYINRNIVFPGPGGNDDIRNANGTTPKGFYVNGTVTADAGSGSDVSSNRGDLANMQTNDPPFYTWVNAIPNTPLPVVLVSFTAKATANAINVTWATSMERNFDHFELERASASLEFTTLTRIQGKGESVALAEYSYNDVAPLNGKNYYRLKSIDLDGSFEYSNVVVALGSFAQGLNVYPNPVEDKLLTVELNDESTEPASVQVLDGAGTLVYTTEILQGASAIQLPNATQPGMYYLRVASQHTQRFVKLIVR